MSKAERDIQTAIMEMLLAHPKVGWAFITTIGKFKVTRGGKSRWITAGFPGMSDIIGQMKDGRMLAIEVKQPGEKPKPEQIDFINTILLYNGVAGWATDIIEAKEIIDE